MADDRVAGRLTRTNRVAVPGVSQPRPDFYVIDLTGPAGPDRPVTWSSPATEAEAAGYRLVFTSGRAMVYQSPDYAGPTPRCAP
ncbi:MAG: hypothetical protein LBS56_09340 [Propionibacteriaceae bacterium]|jgi:hypothetical protein|nr:hypothetical protein [Propionibacteriaceae bacterium]